MNTDINPGPIVSVGIMEGRDQLRGWLDGRFRTEGGACLSGGFVAQTRDGQVIVSDEAGRAVARSPALRLSAEGHALLHLFGVVIGSRFHWERPEDQTFQGNLLILPRPDGTITAINEVPVEYYLTSVISSEMRAEGPLEFLKAHAIMSRSWLMAALERRKEPCRARPSARNVGSDSTDEIMRWYEREDHHLFDVCADDHCQRYHGITKIISPQAEVAVKATSGRVMTYRGAICDARYSKCCGGLTEDFKTAWEDRDIDYLTSISDASVSHLPCPTEEQATRWILAEPDAYCNVKDNRLLESVLPDFDQETKGFFRWTVGYTRHELEDILTAKSGINFGSLLDLTPLERGPSARISRLRIVGTERTITVGKELEIRRWLSRSHLYSSAFTVQTRRGSDGLPEIITLHGAGWGHGVGLCQIGAAAMASRGFSCEQILSHYFRHIAIEKVY
ncbi:MAG TPA: amidase [Deltaproteobacteria bacterium]|nr:amidase [Deltaproteobacteria bacterium]